MEKKAKKQKGCALKASFLPEMAVAGPERVCEKKGCSDSGSGGGMLFLMIN